jgi:WD40 repeat protein
MTLLDNNLKLINKINTSAGLLAFSPDGTKLAVIEYSDVIQKYNVVIRNITNYVNSTIEQPEPLLEFEIENPNPLKNMAFSPDGWMILTTSTYIQNINNFLWNTSTSNKVCAFSSGTPQPSFSSTAFTPDGNNIITIDPANNKSLIVLKIFDVHKQKEIFNYLNRCTLAELLIMQQLCQQGAENNISTFNQLQKALNNIMSSKETNN